MKKFISERLRGVEKTLIRRITDLADSSCIDLGLGELRFPTPKSIIGHIKEKSGDWNLGYTPNEGLQELRSLVAQKCGYSVSPDQVCITVGAEEAVFAVLMVLVNPGDEILVPDPGYPAYPLIVKMAGGLARTYPLHSENRFGLKYEDIEKRISDKTKAVIINSPNNPSGAIYSREEMIGLAKVLEEHEILVISDEVYRDIYFEGEPDSIARYLKNFVVINSLSKSFSMTGWRLGWCIGQQEIIKLIATFHQLAVACAPAISQRAAIFALKGNAEAERLQSREELRKRRQLAMGFIEKYTDLSYTKPAGAFYIFINIADKIPKYGSSLDISMNLLKKEKVVTIPGSAFGQRGEGFLRISFSPPPEQIEEGIRRIGRFFKS
jgi:aminotransferase